LGRSFFIPGRRPHCASFEVVGHVIRFPLGSQPHPFFDFFHFFRPSAMIPYSSEGTLRRGRAPHFSSSPYDSPFRLFPFFPSLKHCVFLFLAFFLSMRWLTFHFLSLVVWLSEGSLVIFFSPLSSGPFFFLSGAEVFLPAYLFCYFRPHKTALSSACGSVGFPDCLLIYSPLYPAIGSLPEFLLGRDSSLLAFLSTQDAPFS